MGQLIMTNSSRAVVRFGSQTWELAVGESVTFGRSVDSDIVIPRQMQDLLVSRHAGRLTAVDGGLLVSNESTSNSLYLQGIPGPELEIKPQMTLGTMPFSRCRLVIFGSHAARYVLGITCGADRGTTQMSPGIRAGPGPACRRPRAAGAWACPMLSAGTLPHSTSRSSPALARRPLRRRTGELRSAATFLPRLFAIHSTRCVSCCRPSTGSPVLSTWTFRKKKLRVASTSSLRWQPGRCTPGPSTATTWKRWSDDTELAGPPHCRR